MRIKCGVNLTCEDIDNGNGAVHCGKIIFVPPRVTIGETTRVSWDEGFWHQAGRKRLKFNATLKDLKRRGGDSRANL